MIAVTSLPALYADKLEQLFAASPTLQAAVNKATELVRDQHVLNDYAWYEDAGGTVLHGMRPLIVLSEANWIITTDTMTSDGGIGTIHGGDVWCLITANAAHPGDNDCLKHKESKREFRNFVGGVMADVERAAGRDDNLLFANVEMTVPFNRTPVVHRTSVNDFWECVFTFHFGMER